jgi:hypothetical protein
VKCEFLKQEISSAAKSPAITNKRTHCNTLGTESSELAVTYAKYVGFSITRQSRRINISIIIQKTCSQDCFLAQTSVLANYR